MKKLLLAFLMLLLICKFSLAQSTAQSSNKQSKPNANSEQVVVKNIKACCPGSCSKKTTVSATSGNSMEVALQLENCPLSGTHDCPLIQNCQFKGTADCPYAQYTSTETTSSSITTAATSSSTMATEVTFPTPK